MGCFRRNPPRSKRRASLRYGERGRATSKCVQPVAKRCRRQKTATGTFPYFVRAAYVWLLVAAGLEIWAAFAHGETAGIWGASRHALTMGFVAAMVFGAGQRVLPAFSGMRHLYSPRLMFFSQALLIVGCTMREHRGQLAETGLD